MKGKPGSSTPPLWAEEFSVHGAEDAYVLRRQFTKFLVLTSLAMTTGNAWIWVRTLFATPPEFDQVPIAGASEVPVGGVKLFAYPTPNDPAILVRKPDGQLVAYSQKCTHLACAVYYSAERNRLECPCHVGYFSVDTGRVLQGPPPRPLPRIRLEERQGAIVATGVDLQGGGT
ncbi:MAG: Rieske 2Fe-2S domain-containing protein [Acidobacteria bacterium]|nr:Rieske 2Fe-2S domain-containing protein [Acidobacteriota bacterium]